MKKLLVFILFLAACHSANSPTMKFAESFSAGFSFTQLAGDFSRPFAGNESWNGEVDVRNVPAPLDLYYRFSWCDFEPFNNPAGSRTFALFDQKLLACVAAGQKFSFGVMTMKDYGSFPGQWQGHNSFLPAYVQNGMSGQVIYGNYAYQNFNDPFYLSRDLALNQAVYDHIVSNGWLKYIDYVDIMQYGNSGEWTSQDHIIGTNAEPSIATFKTLIDHTVQIYKNIQCMAMAAMFDCKTLPGNTNIPIEIGYYALTTSNLKGKLGWKRLSWGESNDGSHAWWTQAWTTGNTHVYNGLDFGKEIRARYLQAPVGGELMNYIDGTHYSDLDRQITEAHANNIGNGNMEGNVNDATAQANAKNAFAKMGARWSLASGSLTASQLILAFHNTGWNPIYDNFIVKYYISQAGVKKYTFSSRDLRLIASDFADTIDLSSVASGAYDVSVSIEDPNGFRKPYPLAITGRNADGSYPLANNASIGGTTPPVPPDSPAVCDTTIRVNRDSVYKVTHDTTVRISKDSIIHRTCPGLSLFTTQKPVDQTDNDYPTWTSIKGIECGTKFVSSISGKITAVKFYKTTGNGGTHIGELYSSSGVRLAQATFTNETSFGWQTAPLSSPVTITAGTTYIVAYFSPNGTYVETNDFFKTSDLVNGTLKAPKDGTNGGSAGDPGNGNGIYIYTATPAFPNQLYASQNGWLDIIFTP